MSYPTKIETGWANEYVGIPFKEFGRGEDGLDCYGLIRLVFLERHNIELPTLLDTYCSTRDRERNAQQIHREALESENWVRILPGQEKPFDVIVARIYGLPCHLAIVVRKGIMLHASRNCDASTEDYTKGTWKAPGKITGFYRHKELC